VADSGAGKDHARQIIKRLLMECDLDNFHGGENIASGPGLISRVSRTPSVLFQLDEFGDLMQAVAGFRASRWDIEIITNFKKLYSESGSIFHGTEYVDQKKSLEMRIEYPCVSLHATTTPDSLYAGFSSESLVSGYLPRMLIVDVSGEPIPPRQKILGQTEIPLNIISWIQRTQNINDEGDLMVINPATPLVVRRSHEARSMFDLFELFVNEKADFNRGNGVDALWRRAWAQADKIATICACTVSLEDPIVSEELALWAKNFVSYHFEKMAVEIRLRLAHTPYEHRRKTYLRAIMMRKNKRGYTVHEINRMKPFTEDSSKDRWAIINDLVNGRQIAKVKVGNRDAYVANK